MEPQIDLRTREVFQRALDTLRDSRLPHLIAGAFATNFYTGVWRNTKDIDVFCEPQRAGAILDALAEAGFTTCVEEQHWLGKAVRDGALVDVIWGGGNWATFVDSHWFDNARRGAILEREVLIAPPEDIILSKAYVAGRERYDGTDIAHLIHKCGAAFDWDALVARFENHWLLLLQYLVLYRFAYPEDRDIVPARLIHELALRIGTDAETADGLAFRGTLVDRYAYLHDVRYEGRSDPREEMARKAGHPVEHVVRRRELDAEALDAGRVYGPVCTHDTHEAVSVSVTLVE
jgi:hypothetical protein